MRYLTLHEPFATLMAIGAKRIETRSWFTRYTGPVAIHAGLSVDDLDLFNEEPFATVLTAAGYRGPADLPLGHIVAYGQLVGCVDTASILAGNIEPFSDLERRFGNYGPDRHGWLFSDVRRVEPIRFTGALGIRRLPVEIISRLKDAA